MKSVFVGVLLVLILSSCNSQSTYERDMRKAKDSYKLEKYEQAIEYLDDALVEKPTDKDAQLLLDKANSKLSLQLSKTMLKKYRDENSSNFAEYLKVWLETNIKQETPSVEQLKTRSDKLKTVYKEAQNVGRNYSRYPEIFEAHKDYLMALDSYIKAYEELLSGLGSSFRVNQYRVLHDDYLQSYKDKIASIKDKKDQ